MKVLHLHSSIMDILILWFHCRMGSEVATSQYNKVGVIEVLLHLASVCIWAKFSMQYTTHVEELIKLLKNI